MPLKEYIGLSQINGPLIFVENIKNVGYNEVVEVSFQNQMRLGQVVQISDEFAVIQVFQGTEGLAVDNTRVKFLGKPLEVKISDEIFGRTFNGIGQPIDGGTEVISGVYKDCLLYTSPSPRDS